MFPLNRFSVKHVSVCQTHTQNVFSGRFSINRRVDRWCPQTMPERTLKFSCIIWSSSFKPERITLCCAAKKYVFRSIIATCWKCSSTKRRSNFLRSPVFTAHEKHETAFYKYHANFFRLESSIDVCCVLCWLDCACCVSIDNVTNNQLLN